MSLPDTALARAQTALTAHLRNPELAPPPGLEMRRLKIYQELLYNNVEGFLSSGFPVLRQILSDELWARLVRMFFVQHRAASPYFLEIGGEFLAFVAEHPPAQQLLPDFALELMHYEWLELALDVSELQLPAPGPALSGQSRLNLSPLARVLAYRYPVHRLGPDCQPDQPPGQPSYLCMFRDRSDRVRFMALNGLTYGMLSQCDGRRCDELIELLMSQLGPAVGGEFSAQARASLQQFADQDILLTC